MIGFKVQFKFNQMQIFEERGKLEYPGEKPLTAEKRSNKLNPHNNEVGNQTGATLVEASALNTTPPLLSIKSSIINDFSLKKNYKTIISENVYKFFKITTLGFCKILIGF